MMMSKTSFFFLRGVLDALDFVRAELLIDDRPYYIVALHDCFLSEAMIKGTSESG